MVLRYSEVATDKDYELAQNWNSDELPMVPEYGRDPDSGLDRVTNPYAVIPDQSTATD